MSQNAFNATEIWESNLPQDEYTFQESASEVDGKYILAKVVGPAFFPDTVSRNKIHYPRKAWENAISNSEFRQKLQDRLVYGTIGHNAELDDDDVREGKFSHIVTNVWIDESGVGKAEYLVLNTPPGNILNTLLRARSKLRVSTKAKGFFESGGSNRDGSRSVTPDNFRLERIDFVIDPGYLQATPELLESFGSSELNTLLKTKGTTMSDEKVVEILESRINELKEEKTISIVKAEQMSAELKTLSESLVRFKTTLNMYESFGTPASIQESFSELEQYRAIGTVHQIHEALDQSEETIDQLADAVDKLNDQLDDQLVEEDGYKELGSPTDVKDALELALQMKDELVRYRELGSIEELQELIDRAGTMAEELENQKVSDCASKYGVNKDVVKGLLNKGMTLDEAESTIAAILGQAAPTAPSESEEEEEEESTPEAETNVEGDKSETIDSDDEVSESLSTKLFQQCGKKAAQSFIESKKSLGSVSLAARLMTKLR